MPPRRHVHVQLGEGEENVTEGRQIEDVDVDAFSERPHSPPLYDLQWSPTDDTVAVSVEDDDYRSETSTETNSKDNSGGSTPKNIVQSYTNHRDLSARLKRAITEDVLTVPKFGQDMIGADVVLCVRQNIDSNTSSRIQDSKIGLESNENTSVVPQVSRFHVHRFMLAASSEPFRAMLTGNMREAAQKEVSIEGLDPTIFERMLLFVYTGEVTLDLQNAVGLLIAAEMYELSGLRDICKSFVLCNAQDVFRDPQMVQIPEKVLIEIIEDDDLQIREIALMEALVMWGEARIANAKKPIIDILSEVMEYVRFPTMSVSDLYGKVRPLVAEGVIRESLLTEALFCHLKWEPHSSKSSHRIKVRAGAAALRKRKRVSFIQHVSFVTE